MAAARAGSASTRPLRRCASPAATRSGSAWPNGRDFRLGDWDAGVDERFDLVLCNPPYVEAGAGLPRDVAEWEPHGALFAGADGLDAYRRLAPQIGRLIAPGGIACVEIGAGQEAAVTALFQSRKLNLTHR